MLGLVTKAYQRPSADWVQVPKHNFLFALDRAGISISDHYSLSFNDQDFVKFLDILGVPNARVPRGGSKTVPTRVLEILRAGHQVFKDKKAAKTSISADAVTQYVCRLLQHAREHWKPHEAHAAKLIETVLFRCDAVIPLSLHKINDDQTRLCLRAAREWYALRDATYPRQRPNMTFLTITSSTTEESGDRKKDTYIPSPTRILSSLLTSLDPATSTEQPSAGSIIAKNTLLDKSISSVSHDPNLDDFDILKRNLWELEEQGLGELPSNVMQEGEERDQGAAGGAQADPVALRLPRVVDVYDRDRIASGYRGPIFAPYVRDIWQKMTQGENPALNGEAAAIAAKYTEDSTEATEAALNVTRELWDLMGSGRVHQSLRSEAWNELRMRAKKNENHCRLIGILDVAEEYLPKVGKKKQNKLLGLIGEAQVRCKAIKDSAKKLAEVMAAQEGYVATLADMKANWRPAKEDSGNWRPVLQDIQKEQQDSQVKMGEID